MATLPHCKAWPTHVHAVADVARPTVKVTAHYQADMTCEQGYHTWGVLLNQRPKDPTSGMHLLPEACVSTALPDDLRACAKVGKTVSIVHTVNKVSEHFASLTPVDAVALAASIEAEAAKHA